jgi:hypothetical protein
MEKYSDCWPELTLQKATSLVCWKDLSSQTETTFAFLESLETQMETSLACLAEKMIQTANFLARLRNYFPRMEKILAFQQCWSYQRAGRFAWADLWSHH